MREPGFVERLWQGEDAGAQIGRAALAPAEALYAGIVALRGAMYGSGLLRSHELALPSVSVGNLSVGGTGKTPVAAWIAAELVARGARPAIVLRGYGDDEPLVHATLNPTVPVIVSPDRVRGAERARVVGADVAVLDDAFQHRRARRSADIVLVSADRWPRRVRLLPAGPWREPLRALRRASLAIVTRKAASAEDARIVAAAVAHAAPRLPVATFHLRPDMLRGAGHPGERALSTLSGQAVQAIAAIGDPDAFVQQLEATGARVRPVIFPDHYAYTVADAERIALEGARADVSVCTLKDAVKLAHLWPRAAAPLWYVSQRVTVERGEVAIASLLDSLVAMRHPR